MGTECFEDVQIRRNRVFFRRLKDENVSFTQIRYQQAKGKARNHLLRADLGRSGRHHSADPYRRSSDFPNSGAN